VKNKSIQKLCFPTDKTELEAKEKEEYNPEGENSQFCNRKGKDSQYSPGKHMGHGI
jgi:hypothetical protein